MSTSCRVDLIFQYKNEMELCILSNQRECFSLKCTCKKGQNNGNSQLNPSYGDFKCTPKKKVMSNACDKEEEQNNNTTDDTVKDNHEQNHTTAIKSNKQNNNCNNTKENETFDNIHRTTTGSNLQSKGSIVLLCLCLFYSKHIYWQKGDRAQSFNIHKLSYKNYYKLKLCSVIFV